MSAQFIQGNHWLEPLTPSGGYPADVLAIADELPLLVGRLQGSIAPETAKRVGELMRITNSYYSNLIEGQVHRASQSGSVGEGSCTEGASRAGIY
ncbi:hypothetical protein [Pseudomonas hormoni]